MAILMEVTILNHQGHKFNEGKLIIDKINNNIMLKQFLMNDDSFFKIIQCSQYKIK